MHPEKGGDMTASIDVARPAKAPGFYRGAALPMAADLAATPASGLRVQLCGDAHLSDFGAFASPERNLVFDVNDFDETLPGPFEWDVKRRAGGEAQAAALIDNCINELARDRARAASLYLDLGLVLGFGVPSGFGLGLGLSVDPRHVLAAGLPLGLLCRDALRGLVGPHEELVQPRRPVILGRRVLTLQAGLRSRPRIQLGRG